MPTYDYECENGHRFEIFQSMKDEPLSTCRDCGASAKRIIGPGAGFLFKGGGFYITDYRSKSYQEKAKSEGNAPKEPSSGGKPKSDSGESSGGGSKSGEGGGTKGPKPDS
jgi:putative FmdB family regulatory protein